VKDYFERNTLIKTIEENKKDIVGAITELFAHNRKSGVLIIFYVKTAGFKLLALFIAGISAGLYNLNFFQ